MTTIDPPARPLPQSNDQLRKWALIALWAIALMAALAIDGPVARESRRWRQLVLASEIAQEIKEGGHAGTTFVICLLLAALHPQKWRAVSLLVLSVVLVALMRHLIAFSTARIRPIVVVDPFSFFNFNVATGGFLHAKNLSFPSGHASLAFASAAALAHLLPKGRWLFFAGAGLVAIERVGESAHYVSDVVAAALLGVLTFKLALRIHERLWKGEGQVAAG